MSKKAFTLAEVLITLGCIGVVAALTIPSLISNYQKRQTVTKLKKVYSVLNQAVKLAEEENGGIEGWDRNMSQAEFFIKHLAPYISGSSISNDMLSNNRILYKNPKGTVEKFFTLINFNEAYANQFVLNDGTLLFLDPSDVSLGRNPVTLAIGVDLNGFSKPNIIGRDFFIFDIIVDYNGGLPIPKVVPYGSYNTSDMPMTEYKREAAKKGSYACSKTGRGMFCAALIMLDNWEIRKDYPW